MDISVVIPLFNESESLPELCSWIEKVMKEHSFTYEMILVDDGSTDGSWDVIRDLSEHNRNIHGLSFRHNSTITNYSTKRRFIPKTRVYYRKL